MATADIQKVYLGLLGRPADAEGLAYWNEEIENGTLTLEQLRANIVNEQPEFAGGPGQLSRADFVTQLYANMFGREPDDAADYWLTGDGASVNLDQLVMAFTDGASEEDTVALNNRATIAQQITDANLALEDDAATLLEGVTNDPATVTAAKQAVEERASGEEESTGGGGGGGGGGGSTSSYTLADAVKADDGSGLPTTYNVSDIADAVKTSLSVQEARIITKANNYANESFSVVDTVTNLTGDQGDLSDATSVTVQLATDGSDADLSGVTLDDDVTAIDLNSQNATLTVAQAGLTITANGGTYAIEDSVTNLTGDQGDLSGATSVTAQLAIDGSDADLSGVTLDDDVDTIDLNGQAAMLSIEQAGLTLSDSSGDTALAARDITIADAFNATVTYSDLTAANLGVNSVTLDDVVDSVATIDFADAGVVNGAVGTAFATDDAITVEVDVTSGNDITTLDASTIGGASVTIDDTTDSYTLSAADYNTAFVTNGLSTSAGDTITVNGTPSTDTINASDQAANFVLNGLDGDNVLTGGNGNDVLSGGLGNDTLRGGQGNDSLTGGGGGQNIFVFAQEDVSRGIDTITDFTTGTDTILVNLNGSHIDGSVFQTSNGLGSGNPNFKAGNVVVDTWTENSTDYLYVAVKDSTGAQFTSSESFRIDIGNNSNFKHSDLSFDLTGTEGNDVLIGGAGDDIINGGEGDDIITGGAGVDKLTGGLGLDTFVNADIANEGNDLIYSFTTDTDGAGVNEGADTLQFSDADLTSITGFADADRATGTTLLLNDGFTSVKFITGSGAVADEAFATFAFDTDTGVLTFDADGTGSEEAIEIGTLFSDAGTTGISDLTINDFSFVA
ncbi:beta strand repeat-containing protein [Vreelandella venusta]|uniref:beta strand repeat-containing protein n=1 Tax=Vreelandella venusta TaxID=44935 RepID=UPI00384D0722